MSSKLKAILVPTAVRRLGADRSGSVAMMFGFAAIAVITAVGGGIDLGRAYLARQKLSEVATLACQYASRPTVTSQIGSGGTVYSTSVNNYITAALTSQKFNYTQTNATPFTYIPGAAADVSLAASVPTTFMRIARLTQMSVGATSHCYDNSNDPLGTDNTVLQETFEKTPSCPNNYCFIQPNGTIGTPATTPSSTFPSTIAYSGAKGFAWGVMGHCLETDQVGVIKSSVPEGTGSAELDCDNGSGTGGNSSISAKAYLRVGNYELRYFYSSRIANDEYGPTYVCGSHADDIAWVQKSTTSATSTLRTNQINVYLDQNTAGVPPTHLTYDGQTLSGGNLIDACVHSPDWIERSVRIYVSTAGNYWLSFAADGKSDSFGGQIDNIRLCPGTCAGSVQESFPSTWTASGGKQLFKDSFESGIVSSTSGCSGYCQNGNMSNSYGTSGTTSSGWPDETQLGWNTAPYNQMDLFFSGAADGSRFIAMDATQQSGMTVSNRLISRPFLLDPGYYKIEYSYKANSNPDNVSNTTVYCGATPVAASWASMSTNQKSNAVGVFMSHSLVASTPNGGFALNAQVTYKNPPSTPSGTQTSTNTPTVAPDAINSYTATFSQSTTSPLIDFCSFSKNWASRSTNVKITKPAYYWLHFSALGNDDGAGGVIDNVRVTALGSLAGSAPTSPVTIPVTDPQPGTTRSFTGFSIVADPLTVPAPTQ